MGPDTLREMARIHDVFAGEPSLSDKLRAHADAWEKQIAEATEANSEIASAHWELCKRLEAAEKIIAEHDRGVEQGHYCTHLATAIAAGEE